MTRSMLIALLTVSAALTGSVARAADSSAKTTTAGATRTSLPADDIGFVREALQGGRREVASSREAMTRTKREDVRSTAQRLMTEHMTLNAELETLAAKKGWGIEPRSLPPQTLTPPSTNTPSDDLDRSYVETQIHEHERSIEMFRRQSTGAHDADVRELAADALPRLEQHLAALTKLRD